MNTWGAGTLTVDIVTANSLSITNGAWTLTGGDLILYAPFDVAGGTLTLDTIAVSGTTFTGIFIDNGDNYLDFSGLVTFTGAQTIAGTTELDSAGIEAQSNLILDNQAYVHAGYGNIDIVGALDLSAGDNFLFGHNLSVDGAYSDAASTYVELSGKATFNDAADTMVNSTYFESLGLETTNAGLILGNGAGVFAGYYGGTIDIDTNNGIGNLDLAAGNNWLEGNTLTIGNLTASGSYFDADSTIVDLSGKATFNDTNDTMIRATGFSAWPLGFSSIGLETTKAGLILANGARVDAGYGDPNGNIKIAGDLDLTAGDNQLGGNELSVDGAYSDAHTTHVFLSGAATFNDTADTIVNSSEFRSASLETTNAGLILGNGAEVIVWGPTGDGNIHIAGDLNRSAGNNWLYGRNLLVDGAYLDANSAYTSLFGKATFNDTADTTIHSTNFSSVGLETTNAGLILGNGASVDAGFGDPNGNIDIAGDLDLTAGNNWLSGNDLDVKGKYSDVFSSNIALSGEFKYNNNPQTINSGSFQVGTLHVSGTQDLTLGAGANVITGSNSNVAGRLTLNNGSQFGSFGNTVTNTGTIAVNSGTATFAGNFNNQGSLVIGKYDSTTADSARLNVSGSWVSNSNGLGFVVDDAGTVGKLTITGAANTSNAANNVTLIGNEATGLYQLGTTVSDPNNVVVLVTASDASDPDSFTMDPGNSSPSKWDFALTAVAGASPGTTDWKLSVTDATTLPDISSFFLANIIAFDLPRAQNISGPWVRVKGGQLYDNIADMHSMSFQMLQVGWDKSFDAAVGSGHWFAGIFFEGDWMYGNGIYYRNKGQTNAGVFRSSHRGMGSGLYVSRGFESGWYCDLLGRISMFNSKVDMVANPNPDYSGYNGAWIDQMFSMGLEIGKSIDSRNGRFSFNPYNRLLYHSTPTTRYSIEHADAVNSTTLVHSHAVDAWTNQLAGRLYWNSIKNGTNFGNIYIGADYYQGLSGKFAIDVRERGTSSAWKPSGLARTKNNLSYGVGAVGMTYRPKENISLNSQLDMLFGDVSGWAATVAFRYSY